MNLICGVQQQKKQPLPPYSEVVCEFLDSFSAALRHDAEAKQYPDVMTFAFWARKGSIQKRKEEYIRLCGAQTTRLGRGIVFHIAPSNVPVNCMFTYAFGLLAGNGNIVRIPTKEFPQLECMCRVLRAVLQQEAFSGIKEMTTVVRYDRMEDSYTKQYSGLCDTRVIWGGDDTIRTIREIQLPPRSVEITFADRYSFGLLDAKTVAHATEAERNQLAKAFYNDTYLMDQNACSTPSLICWWKGSAAEEELSAAKEGFWRAVYEAASKYDLADVKVSEKYATLCEQLMRYEEVSLPDDTMGQEADRMNEAGNIRQYDNRLYVCELSEIPADVTLQCRGRYGLFFEHTIASLEALAPLSDTRVQTCAVYGMDEDRIRSYIKEQGFLGIDRVVPFGKTLDIDTFWDGYDLIASMSRIIL